eukprot:TRINITY_DN2785_c0_g1_i1.p1 TRINITY_DN2785_c0_g1~~TRINITY_DN2785_c0_g1_i1.p1  ORF type:complete len:1023 (-),score=383.18 TRINITY_DN2785_c0_g1_i1:159-3227(-)
MGQELSSAVFQPPRRDETYTEGSLEGIFWVSSQYNHVPAVHMKWRGRNDKTAYFTLLYCGGNSEDLGRVQAWMKTLKDTLHVDIVCFDYTGYGVHLGEASEKKCYDDVMTVYKHMTTEMGIASDRIIVVGKDLGSAVAIRLAHELSSSPSSNVSMAERIARRGMSVLSFPAIVGSTTTQAPEKEVPEVPLAGIVLLSPFLSLLSLIEGRANKQAASRAYGDIFSSDKKIGSVGCPAYVVHGALDDVIPSKHGRRVAAKLPNLWKFLELEDAGHYNLEYADDFLDDFIDFVEYLGRRGQGYEEQVTQPKLEKPSFYVDTTKEVTEFFAALGLEHLSATVLQNGFTDMMAVSTLQEIDLRGMGFEDQAEIDSVVAAIQKSVASNPPTPRGTAPSPPVTPASDADAPDEIKLDDVQRRKKKTSKRKHKRSSSRVDHFSVSKAVSENSMDMVDEFNPDDEEGFVKLLLAMDTSLSLQPLQNMPARWRQSISFATSINIDYNELESVRTLSKGFFGEVFVGVWRKAGGEKVDVVVRVISYKRSVFRQFCKEALVLSQLKHPNVIETIGACMSRDTPLCIVLELLSGGSLYDYLHKEELSVERRIALAIGIASGLEYLHTRIPAIIHRDLTSRNILLAANGTPKLADFGLGRPPSFIWMAPEIYSKKAISAKADIYSLGVVLWEIWTQKPPFEGIPAAQVANKACKEGLRPEIPEAAPVIWKELMEQCWDASPEARPSASHVLGQLKSLSDEVEVLSAKRGMLLDISFLEQYGSDDEEALMSPTRSVEEMSPLAVASDEQTLLGSVSMDSLDSARRKARPKHKRTGSVVTIKKRTGSSAGGPSPESSPKPRRRRKDSQRPPDESYTSLLSYQLRSMVNDREFSDVRFVVGEEGEAVFGHRALLAARSKHFRVLMRSQPSAHEFEFPKISVETFLTIMTYLYTGGLEVEQLSDCYAVIEAAHELGMPEVVRVCTEHLGDAELDVLDAKKLPPQDQLELTEALEKISNVETDISSMEETLNALTERLRNL